MPLHCISRELVADVLLKHPSLAVFNVSQNCISKIENLEGLRSLEKIDASFNQISQIENLSALRRLRLLNLSNNRISEIPVAVHIELPVIEALDLSSNLMTDIEALTPLRKCVFLKELGAAGNPFQQQFEDEDQYREAVSMRVPGVEVIDGIRITDDERRYWKIRRADARAQSANRTVHLSHTRIPHASAYREDEGTAHHDHSLPGEHAQSLVPPALQPHSQSQSQWQRQERVVEDHPDQVMSDSAGGRRPGKASFASEMDRLDQIARMRVLESQLERTRMELLETQRDRDAKTQRLDAADDDLRTAHSQLHEAHARVKAMEEQVTESRSMLDAERDTVRQLRELLFHQKDLERDLKAHSEAEFSMAVEEPSDDLVASLRDQITMLSRDLDASRTRIAALEDITAIQDEQLQRLSSPAGAEADPVLQSSIQRWREAAYRAILKEKTLGQRVRDVQSLSKHRESQLMRTMESNLRESAVIRKRLEGAEALVEAEKTRVKVLEGMIKKQEDMMARERTRHGSSLAMLKKALSPDMLCGIVEQVIRSKVSARLEAYEQRLAFATMRIHWLNGLVRNKWNEVRTKNHAVQVVRQSDKEDREKTSHVVVDTLRKEIDSLRIERDSLSRRSQIEDTLVEERFQRMKVFHDADLEDRDRRIAALTREAEEKRREVETLKSEASRSVDEVVRLKHEIRRRDDEIDRLEKEVQRSREDSDASSKTEIIRWKEKEAEARESIAKLERDIAKKESLVRKAEKEIAKINELRRTEQEAREVYWEEKTRRKDDQIGALQKERNTLLASLRQLQRTPMGVLPTAPRPRLQEKVRSLASLASDLLDDDDDDDDGGNRDGGGRSDGIDDDNAHADAYDRRPAASFSRRR
eukprot:ANDGO_06292.mRNA.1 Leucine-rich repeat-containing protein ODA7